MPKYNTNFIQTVSGSASTVTQQLSLTTGAGRRAAIYDFFAALAATVPATNAQISARVFGVSALTAGAAVVPVNLDQIGGAASTTTSSSTPTAVTTSGLALIELDYSSFATVRWTAWDADSRIVIPSGGGTGGEVASQNLQYSAVAGLSVSHVIYFME